MLPTNLCVVKILFLFDLQIKYHSPEYFKDIICHNTNYFYKFMIFNEFIKMFSFSTVLYIKIM